MKLTQLITLASTAALFSFGLVHPTMAGNKTYKFNSFIETAKGNCADKVDSSVSGSVTKTVFDGKNGSKKPSNITLTVGGKADDTTPTGTDGNWAGSTNSFNGSSTRSAPIKILLAKPEGAKCEDYNGTSVSFE